MAKQYEYRFAEVSDDIDEGADSIDQLNELGRDGWQVVYMIRNLYRQGGTARDDERDHYEVWLMREIEGLTADDEDRD